MTSTPLGLNWIVCHDEERIVVRRSVACPSRGPTPGIVCLGCRFLVTSSLERAPDGWCAAAPSRPDVRSLLVVPFVSHR